LRAPDIPVAAAFTPTHRPWRLSCLAGSRAIRFPGSGFLRDLATASGVAVTGLPSSAPSGARAVQIPALTTWVADWWRHVLAGRAAVALLFTVSRLQSPQLTVHPLGRAVLLRMSTRRLRRGRRWKVEPSELHHPEALEALDGTRSPFGGSSRRRYPLRGYLDSRDGSLGVARPHRFTRLVSGSQPLAASRSLSERATRLSSGHSRGSSTNLRERVFKSFP